VNQESSLGIKMGVIKITKKDVLTPSLFFNEWITGKEITKDYSEENVSKSSSGVVRHGRLCC
jgi:hypothetical protein